MRKKQELIQVFIIKVACLGDKKSLWRLPKKLQNASQNCLLRKQEAKAFTHQLPNPLRVSPRVVNSSQFLCCTCAWEKRSSTALGKKLKTL
jgi:hypothetical protein